MRKLFLTSGVLLFCFGTLFAQNKLMKLPQTTQDFVKKYFPNEKVRSVVREKEILNFDNDELYEMVLENGIKMDFNKAGNLTEIKSIQGVEIPKEVLPKNIYSYVEKNFPTLKITHWEADSNNQEVELSDGTELEFNKNGKFLRVD